MNTPAEGVRIGRLQQQRLNEIYLRAVSDGSVDASELAKYFDVSTETIRRDLSELQARQLVRRVHGGAVPVDRQHHEPMIDARNALHAEQKAAIARRAIAQIPERGSIIIDSGSTGQRLAEAFPAARQLHVITNSLAIATQLSRRGVAELTVLGGAVRTNTLAMVDSSVVDTLRRMQVDVLFMSCDGLSLGRGLTTPYREEYLVKRAMMEAARWVVAIVDASKFGNEQTFCHAAFDELDVLVTDDRVNADDVRRIEDHGVEVIVA